MREEEWQGVLDVHLNGFFNVSGPYCGHAPPRSGRIVSIVSASARSACRPEQLLRGQGRAHRCHPLLAAEVASATSWSTPSRPASSRPTCSAICRGRRSCPHPPGAPGSTRGGGCGGGLSLLRGRVVRHRPGLGRERRRLLVNRVAITGWASSPVSARIAKRSARPCGAAPRRRHRPGAGGPGLSESADRRVRGFDPAARLSRKQRRSMPEFAVHAQARSWTRSPRPDSARGTSRTADRARLWL
jgi:hypothetical protein